MDLFAFIHHANPTKVRIGKREVREGEVPLLELTRGRVVLLPSVDDQGNANVQGVGDDDVNEESGDAAGGDRIDSVTGPKLRTQHPVERFVGLSNSPCHSSSNATDAEVSSVVRIGEDPVHGIIFLDSTSAGTVGPDIAGPSQPAGTELSADTFYVSQYMDSEMLHQIYVPRWNMVNESALDDPNLFAEFNIGAAHQKCLGAEVRMRLEHELRGRKKFEGKCAMEANLLKERDADMASLKAQFSLKEAEAAEAIRLCDQIATVEAVKAAQVSALDGLKERNATLEGHVAALESAAVIKDAELVSSNAQIAKLTQDLSNFRLSCDELSIKAASLESKKDKLTDQVSMLETTCSELCNEVSDSELMGMALHLDEEFYPRYLTTIARRRWILGRSFKLTVMKCLQSLEYLAALGWAIGHAINKGMQDGLTAGIDHGKGGKGLANVSAYNPSAKTNYISRVNALCAVDFPLLAQLDSYKDASIADIMGL
uniref:Transposase (Putative), gypsy type n=1 Tax=Tanacetum cinerariifolium TaxID=118510 RepID=A0A699H6W5_TANCI|nr:hypothetical protein [Tanacetum cinerariifolium]